MAVIFILRGGGGSKYRMLIYQKKSQYFPLAIAELTIEVLTMIVCHLLKYQQTMHAAEDCP
jgi:hypothetical protein